MGGGGLDGAGVVRHDFKNITVDPYGPDGHSGTGGERCDYFFVRPSRRDVYGEYFQTQVGYRDTTTI
jgi:hypothetical protein